MKQTQMNLIFLLFVLLCFSFLAWMLYYNTYGYAARDERDEAFIQRSFFKARKAGMPAETAVARVTERYPAIKCERTNKSESSLMPGFQGYFCLGPTVVNHIGMGYETMRWIEADDDGRLVGVWQSFRFPIKERPENLSKN
jgi:hypothetical protein